MVLILFLAVSYTRGASPNAGQCAGFNDPANVKTDTDNGDLVLAAGLTVCVKGGSAQSGDGNTGQIVTDGVTTLNGYLLAAGIDANVSNYVVYGTQPTAPPTEEPTAPPTEAPTEPPATDTPTEEPTKCVGCGGAHEPSFPDTATADNTAGTGSPNGNSILLLAAALVAWAVGITMLPVRGRNRR